LFRDVSFEFATTSSWSIVIIGRSGCGKTTLLNAVAGLEKADSGEVVNDFQSAFVFQDDKLIPWLTVLDNVTIGGVSALDAKESLRQVGLEGFEKRYPKKMSGGEKARVALARALVRKPELLLLDEPFSALDAITRTEMQRLVKTLQGALGFAILMVTHDLAEAESIADQILVLPGGRIYDAPFNESDLMKELGL
jgi:sulfonate transport system ATP-binding protein